MKNRGMGLLRLVASGLVLAEERSGIQARANTLSPTRQHVDVLTPEYRDFMRKAYALISSINGNLEKWRVLLLFVVCICLFVYFFVV